MIPCMERYGTKSKNSKFSKIQIFVLLACHFPETTGKRLDLIWFELENGKRYNKTGKLECFQTVRHKDLGFQLLQTMFAVWNRVRHFLLWYRFFLKSCSSGSFSNFRCYFSGSSCNFRWCFLTVFDISRCHYSGFLRFPYDSIRFHAYNYIIPCDSMLGTIWFHTIPCMESYDSIRFHTWNHMISCDSMHGNGMKLSYGTIWFHAWNRMEDLWIWIRVIFKTWTSSNGQSC